ncbi:MAG: complex I subunit 4 family protein [bacterium]
MNSNFYSYAVLFLILAHLILPLFLFFIKEKYVRCYSIIIGSLLGAFSIFLAFSFYYNPDISLFTFSLNLFGLDYKFRIDNFNYALVFLNGLITFAVPLATHIKDKEKDFYILTFVVLLGTIGLFLTQNMILFVLFYELASVPMYFLIANWGSLGVTPFRKVEPKYAAMKLLIYLQLGGILVMLGFFILHSLVFPNDIFSNWNFSDYENVLKSQGYLVDSNFSKILFILFFVAFGIEAALVPFHTWLPDGHSAAPSSISMILAGILLKMGTYGILRIPFVFFNEALNTLGLLFVFWGLINMFWGAFNAYKQIDFKYLIAYSSISHMGVIFMGIGANNDLGVSAAIFQMVSHGLISAVMFSVAGSFQYRTNTRILDNYGGLLRIMPFIGSILVFASMANLGLPGLSGFVAELIGISAALKAINLNSFKIFYLIFALSSIFITTVYVINLLEKVLYKKINPNYYELKDAYWDEKLHLTILALFILILGIYPGFIITLSNLAKINKIIGM